MMQCTLFVAMMVICGIHAEYLALGWEFGVGIVQGRVFSFGTNVYGQLGIGSFGPNSFSSEVHLIDEFGSGGVVAVAAGHQHIAVIDATGTVYTWGAGGSDGRLGLGYDTNNRNSPSAVEAFGSGSVVKVSCGGSSTWAIDSNGNVFAWGRNRYGEIGRPVSEGQSNVPIPMSVDEKKVIAVSGGGSHACFVTEDQMLYCVGWGAFGQIGNGDFQDRDTPTQVSNVVGSSNLYNQISCGEYHSCGLDTDGNVLCWGWGANGQLGQGNGVTSHQSVPTSVVKSWGEATVGQISVGFNHACVYDQQGRAWCFGQVEYRWIPASVGGLSADGNAEIPIAMRVDDANGVELLALGGRRTCVKQNGTLIQCYGKFQMAVSDEYEVLDFSEVNLGSLSQSATSSAVVTTTTTSSTSVSEAVDETITSTTTVSISSSGSVDKVTTPRFIGPTNAEITEPRITSSQSDDAVEKETSKDTIERGSYPVSEDNTLYIILGASGAALCCLLVFVIAVLKVCISRKAKRHRPQSSSGATSLAPHTKGNAHLSSRSGRSKSVSRSASRGKLGATGGPHGKRRSVKVVPNYGQLQLTLPVTNEYDTLSLSSLSTASEHANANEYHTFNLSSSGLSGSEYNDGMLQLRAENQYNSIPSRPLMSDEYASGDVVNMNE